MIDGSPAENARSCDDNDSIWIQIGRALWKTRDAYALCSMCNAAPNFQNPTFGFLRDNVCKRSLHSPGWVKERNEEMM